jgi:hypothetical protein
LPTTFVEGTQEVEIDFDNVTPAQKKKVQAWLEEIAFKDDPEGLEEWRGASQSSMSQCSDQTSSARLQSSVFLDVDVFLDRLQPNVCVVGTRTQRRANRSRALATSVFVSST